VINVVDPPYSPSLGFLSGPGISITTAPEGASIEHVEAGMREVEEVKRAQTEDRGAELTSPSALSTTVQPAEQTGV